MSEMSRSLAILGAAKPHCVGHTTPQVVTFSLLCEEDYSGSQTIVASALGLEIPETHIVMMHQTSMQMSLFLCVKIAKIHI
jgi:hypothetical protein